MCVVSLVLLDKQLFSAEHNVVSGMFYNLQYIYVEKDL